MAHYSDEIRSCIFELYKKGYECKGMASWVGISHSTLWNWISKAGLTRNPEVMWTKSDIDLLRSLWTSDLPIEDVVSHFPNRSYDALTLKASRLGLKRDIYAKSILDFDVVDSEEKAYILGFGAADGNVFYKSACNKSFQIALSSKDESHLRKIRDRLSPKSQIYTIKTNYKDSYACRFSVCDVNLCNSLEKWGIVPNKSLILKPPISLSEAMIRHWIRGYFDGDGSLGYYISPKSRKAGTNKAHCQASMCGTSEVLGWIDTQFVAANGGALHKPRLRKKHYVLQYSTSIAEDFLRWIYKDATLYLDRKYGIAKRCLET